MSRKFEVKIGDRVAYSAKWLRNTGQITGQAGQMRGIVTAVDSPTPAWSLATIRWEKVKPGAWPEQVNVANLALAGPNLRFANC